MSISESALLSNVHFVKVCFLNDMIPEHITYHILHFRCLCTLLVTLQQTIKQVVCCFTHKEAEAQKGKYISQGQTTVKKENQKASSDASDPGEV